MAEIITNSKPNSKKFIKKNIMVDLTPMVDLGFLLITFFVITTALQEQKQIKLLLPKDSTDSTLTRQATTLTFILKGHDSIGYYEGLAKETMNQKFGAMRTLIQQKETSLINNHIDKNKLTIIIKSTPESSYKNFIDALDEVSINDCKHL